MAGQPRETQANAYAKSLFGGAAAALAAGKKSGPSPCDDGPGSADEHDRRRALVADDQVLGLGGVGVAGVTGCGVGGGVTVFGVGGIVEDGALGVTGVAGTGGAASVGVPAGVPLE
jgi:hypothetical protein